MSILSKGNKGDFFSQCKEPRERPFQSKINLFARQFYENTLAAACANRGNLSRSLACSLRDDRPRCSSVDAVLIRIQTSDGSKQLRQNKSLKAFNVSNTAMKGGRKKSASNKIHSNVQVRKLHLNPGKQCVPLQLKTAEKKQQLIEERNVFEDNFPVGYYIAKAIEQLTKPGPSLRQAHVAPKINQITGEVGKRLMIKCSKQQVATIDPNKCIRKQLNFDYHIKKSVGQKSQDSHDLGCISGEIETQEIKKTEPEGAQLRSTSQQVSLSEIQLSNTPQNHLSAFALEECKQFGSPLKIRNRIHVTNQQELNKLISIRSKKNLSLLQRKYLRVNLPVNGSFQSDPLRSSAPFQSSKARPKQRPSLLFKFMPEK